jgi:hypothetical protein
MHNSLDFQFKLNHMFYVVLAFAMKIDNFIYICFKYLLLSKCTDQTALFYTLIHTKTDVRSSSPNTHVLDAIHDTAPSHVIK